MKLALVPLFRVGLSVGLRCSYLGGSSESLQRPDLGSVGRLNSRHCDQILRSFGFAFVILWEGQNLHWTCLEFESKIRFVIPEK